MITVIISARPDVPLAVYINVYMYACISLYSVISIGIVIISTTTTTNTNTNNSNNENNNQQ